MLESKRQIRPVKPKVVKRLPATVCYGTNAPMSQHSRPVYLRLRDLIAAAIIDGTYAEGAALPSVRAFAAQQGANPLTAAKAYQQFQLDGLIEVRRGVGMYVAIGAADKLRASERAAFLRDEWPGLCNRLRILGIDPAELLAEA